MDLIIYHKSCPDGFCAALVASKRYPEAKLLPKDHGSPVPYEEVTGKNVLVLDFSWRTRAENLELVNRAHSLRILDHHKSAQAVLDGLPFATFDMERSGAGLAWDYLFGKDRDYRLGPYDDLPVFLPRPWYVDYVEDRDLWRHALPESKEVNAYLMTLPFTVEAWAALDKITPEQAANSGRGALAHVEHYVREGVKQAQEGKLIFLPTQGLYKVKIVNALYMNISELAGALAEEPGIDIGIGYFERGDGIMQFSLRSRSDVDVSAIALSLGGGGHQHAAGFQLPLTVGRAWVDSILGRELICVDGRPYTILPAYK